MPRAELYATLTDEIIRRLEPVPGQEAQHQYRISRALLQEAAEVTFTLSAPLSEFQNRRISFEADIEAGWLPLLCYRLSFKGEPPPGYGPTPTKAALPDPLIGILRGFGYGKAEADSWAGQVTEGTPEERFEEVLRRKGKMMLNHEKVKAGMPAASTLRALAATGCEKTAEDVATEQGVDRTAIEAELTHIRAYAEGAVDLGTGTLIMDHEKGEVTHRIGSGLPTWLQDLGGPKAILEALERRAGKLYDDLLALAIANVREPVPF